MNENLSVPTLQNTVNVPVDYENNELTRLPTYTLSVVRPIKVGNLLAVLDAEDYELVSQYKWHLRKAPHTYYAYAWISPKKHAYLHRLILSAPKGILVDHRDGNGLNNLRSNIRLCNYRQNLGNAKIRVGKTHSIFKGVSRRNNKWIAQICHTHIGTFNTELEAAEAYKIAAAKFFGEFSAFKGQLKKWWKDKV